MGAGPRAGPVPGQAAGRDRGLRRITDEIPGKVLADQDYSNAKANNDEANARIALTGALSKVMGGMLRDETQLFKQFINNPEFKRWPIFQATYDK